MSKQKMRRAGARILVLLLCACLLCAATPVFAAEGAFRYRHDPRINPSAMADVIVDPTAIYGFSPSPEGSLKAYAAFDWSDPELVNGEQGRLERIAYHESIAEMYTMLDEMTAAGNSVEEIARAVSNKRNEIRLAAYDDDPEGLEAVKARNLERYGHEEGPQPDELYAQYGSWETVIEKAFSANSGMDACLGLYDDYYELYLASGQILPEDETAATREYAVAAFVDASGYVPAGSTDGALDGFTDAEAVSPWFADELRAAAADGLIEGYEDGTLQPQGTIRRIEALVLLSRCLPELEETREALVFSDLPAWAQPDIDRLSRAGLVEGCEDGRLGADDELTVEQVGILTARLAAGTAPAKAA